jgi:hypothetical protein
VSRLQIELDQATDDALTTLAAAHGKAPADLVAEWVSRYVKMHELFENGDQRALGGDEADPMDALVGKYSGDRVNDVDAVVYGRLRDPVNGIVDSAREEKPVDEGDEAIRGR